MVVGLLGNKSPDSNRFTLVTPKPENGVRLQATLGSKNPTGLPMGVVSRQFHGFSNSCINTVDELEDFLQRYCEEKKISFNIGSRALCV